jgi:phage tail protein X
MIIPGMILDGPNAGQIIPPGYPAPEPNPGRIYTSIQGDWWDLIAIRVYGRRRGNENLMYRLLEENYALREVAMFPAALPVIVPEIAVAAEIPLVPWTSATVITTP